MKKIQGERMLRAARQRLGLRVLDVAAAARISEGRLYRIEQGRTRATDEERARLADALGQTVALLFPEVTP